MPLPQMCDVIPIKKIVDSPFIHLNTMPADPETLYGIARPRRRPEQEISTSTSAAFSSQLQGLLSQSRSGEVVGSGRSRSRPDVKSRKENIFTTHQAKKRAASEVSKDESGRVHQTQDVIGGVDEAVLKHSKRKLEDKARLYAAMKRGDYVNYKKTCINDEEHGPLVDFDRKWAEGENGAGLSEGVTTSEDEAESESEGLVEYTDEFGRLRKGTRADIARLAQKRRIQQNAAEELDEMSARPSKPANLIHGDVIQAAAFNPDAAIERQMADLAARRDRSMTPPEETHYDASKEIRSKGVGFYQFSKDSDKRRDEFDTLEKSRQQTEHWEKERRKNRERKEKEFSQNTEQPNDRKTEREANAFLKTLETGLTGFVTAGNFEPDTQQTGKKQKKGWGK